MSDVTGANVGKPGLSPDAMREYIKRYGNTLPIDMKKELCKLIIMNDKREEIKECNIGCVINLDNLSDNIVEHLYIFVAHNRNESREL